MNKALELIEAHFLFNFDANDILPVIHRESIIHSAVEFSDGSYLAQMSLPDMRLPISLAINGYEHQENIVKPLDFTNLNLHFEKVNNELFPSIEIGKKALKLSNEHPAVFNSANEECVKAFLAEKLEFKKIFTLLDKAVMCYNGARKEHLLDCILYADMWGRKFIRKELCL
jgi:1-deoxy-D-xylulose-5-phosphate reductoisomerase